MQITLKAARINSGLKQKEVCEKLNIAQSTIVRWEQGETFPTVQQLCALCRLYNCTLDDIFVPEILT